MDGVTDAHFRYITDIYGKPDIIYTEFVSVKGLIIGSPQFRGCYFVIKPRQKQ